MLLAASVAHAAALAAVHAAAFPPGERWDEAAFAALLGQPGVFGLVEDNGGLVLFRVAADEAEILTLGVLPEARRQGLGRWMLDEAAVRAGRVGAKSMFLEVAEDNVAARALYAAAGFSEVARRRGYYAGRIDAMVLRRDLPPCAGRRAGAVG